MRKRKKASYTILIIIAVLLIIRLILPYAVKRYVNNTLQNIPGYWGSVDDIDLNFYRGAYVIHKLKLDKVNGESNIPFLDFEKSDISLQWSSLFDGKIVSEIKLHRPKITYVFEEQAKDSAGPTNEDWSKALTDLVPIDINELTVTNGKVGFIQFNKSPDVDLFIDQIDLRATNLRNVVNQEEKLPSSVHLTAVSIGQGNVSLDGEMDLVKQVPDIDFNFSLENADVKALNSFTLAYAGFDFEKGNFDLFSEVAIKDGYLKGYFKPILTDTKIVDDFGKEDSDIFKKAWEGFVGFFKFIFKNQKEDSLATKIPVEGDLNNVGSNIFTTIVGIFKNAFIEAYKGEVDGTIKFHDASKESKEKEENTEK
ncbi:DUF748 domain-containing protein [Galbibacter mesophilus]|uniref:DUF748 domain-containing protein n=1 Tax=Galbibacter mesophilus TaxID=379069 RepID=UPI00191F2D8A|nr:DUF748 domain-containing protein [Galbibacter mesophilus]MCM5661405.1 DUF748 domain-containing protein [Galbibacter mesophilus]